MKYLIITAIAVLTFSVSAQSTDGIKIDDMVNRTIKGLQKFDTTDIKPFKELLISETEIQDFITAMDANEAFKKELRSNIDAGIFKNAMEASYMDFVMETQKTDINWKKISYENFLYELRLRDGLNQLRGNLYFNEGENKYQVQITAGLLNGKFVVIGLEDFRKQRDMTSEEEAERMIREMEEAMEAAAEEVAEEEYIAEEELIERIREMEEVEEEPVAIYEEEYEQVEPVQAEIMEFPDFEAQFPGGTEAMSAYISKNVVYPQEAIQKGIQGRVYISFIVERDGTLTNVEVMRGVSPELDQEAMRVIKSMPKWTPAETGGRVVRSKVRIPIIFQLSDK